MISPSSSLSSDDLHKESEELQTLIPKGFEVIGALAYGAGADAQAAIHAARRLRKLLYGEEEEDNRPVIGAVTAGFGELKFFVSESEKSNHLEEVDSVVEEEHSEKCVGEWLLDSLWASDQVASILSSQEYECNLGIGNWSL
ncbi:probable Ufm1-specific protease [Arachis stenosperma]|uniref:probable Ufm1-specific protease n=1 Tax=Arachis stenosperma TaxID=217475 RepID=UPI0025ABFD09|nr:probable Ufm1-specific protease [Arachis stenosperma]